MDGAAATQTHDRGVEREVGAGDQHFIAVVEQGLHAHLDQLGGAIAQVDIVDGDAADLLFLAVMHHRLARRKQAFGIGVAGRGGQVTYHVLHDLVGRLQAEGGHIADVQLDDLLAFFLHRSRLVQHGAPNVVADIG